MECNHYENLLNNNKKWVDELIKRDPEYFKKLSKGQDPTFLFIGCSDSRVSLTQIIGSKPGEIFVHRNIGNQVDSRDMNMLAILEYSVDVLKVDHVIVFGHYQCGGVKAAVDKVDEGLVENWVNEIKDLYYENKTDLETITDHEKMLDRLAEINAVKQAENVIKTPVMQRAIKKDKYPLVHAWIFDIYTGLIKNLDLPIDKWEEIGLITNEYKNCDNNE